MKTNTTIKTVVLTAAVVALGISCNKTKPPDGGQSAPAKIAVSASGTPDIADSRTLKDAAVFAWLAGDFFLGEAMAGSRRRAILRPT